MPGLGHVHARLWNAGVAIMAVSLAVSLAMVWSTRVLPPTPGSLIAFFAVGVIWMLLQLAVAIDAARRERTALDRFRPRWFRSSWLAAIVCLAVSVWLMDSFGSLGWRTYTIPSTSMEPTLYPGDLWMAKIATAPHNVPARGSVVAFRVPRQADTIYVKRVIGVPGDRIALVGGTVVLNGSPVTSTAEGTAADATNAIQLFTETMPDGTSYRTARLGPHAQQDDMAELTVPADHLFVLGDLRDNSVDSRFPYVGMVPVNDVVAGSGVVYWANDRSRILTQIR